MTHTHTHTHTHTLFVRGNPSTLELPNPHNGPSRPVALAPEDRHGQGRPLLCHVQQPEVPHPQVRAQHLPPVLPRELREPRLHQEQVDGRLRVKGGAGQTCRHDEAHVRPFLSRFVFKFFLS